MGGGGSGVVEDGKRGVRRRMGEEGGVGCG